MKKIWLSSLFLISAFAFGQKPAEFVNPFIGTSNYGATHPGPIYPHGMASVSPFNVASKKGTLNKYEKDSEWHSRPYVKENKYLTGFSHVNLSGVGCPELGSIITMPTTGDLQFDMEKYGSTFSGEKASPGYYIAHLDKYNIEAKMTSTPRTGLSGYTFPKGKANLLLNLGLGLTNESGAHVKILTPTSLEGYKTIGTFCYNPEDVRPVYFAMELSKKPRTFGTFKKMPLYKNVEAEWVGYNNTYKPYSEYLFPMSGDKIGAYFSYDFEKEETIWVKIGISYVSTQNAWENLKNEQPGFDFEKIKKKNEDKWNELLSRIEVHSDDTQAKTIFYTALYHTLLHPNVINDVNGEYPLMGQAEVGKTDQKRYTVFSLWDTYRNVHPLLSLVYPEIQSEMINTMTDMYKENGWLPKWELLGMETNVMVGDPATPVIADTYLRGIRNFDVQTAYDALVKSSETKESQNSLRPGIDDYNKLGYVPEDTTDKWGGNVSTSLEYYIADWNIAQLAKKLGKADDYKKFLRKSHGYKNLFDSKTGMLRPKFANGVWYSPFDPESGKNFEATIGYVEGNAWQYRFYVPHDIDGLIKLVGGAKIFQSELQRLFDSGNYDMANEPDITFPYLFNYIKGKEWKSQKIVNELINKHYNNTSGGIPGNDDTGTLSAWLIFSMLGIYPICPGDMDYSIVKPYFKEVTIHLNEKYYSGRTLKISKNSHDNKSNYIESIFFNDKKIDTYFIDHQTLTNGGTLSINVNR